MEYEFDESNIEIRTDQIRGALLQIANSPTVQKFNPDIAIKADILREKEKTGDGDQIELAFLELYCEIHRTGSVYSSGEREDLDKKHGYFNHPGGISPLLKAEEFIHEDTILVDLGAGNGLQGLLFQLLYPHHKTIQIELSSEMIRFGQKLTEILNISDSRIEWINEDILDFNFEQIDFIYLYRPSKPINSGVQLYHDIVSKLDQLDKPVVIFSIADCLKDFLTPKYKMFYSDGHLTCFHNQRPAS